MIPREQIVESARTWLGTPYKHQFSVKGAGCDCLGLIRGVYRENIGEEPEKAPAYSPSWGEAGKRELMLEVADKHLIKSEEPEVLKPGQVLFFRMRSRLMVKHCGIVGLPYEDHNQPGTMIHAYNTPKMVVEHGVVPFWTEKLVAVYDFPGVG